MRKFIVNCSSLIVNSLVSFFLLLTITSYLLPVALAQQATLSLSPSSGTFNQGCDFTVDVKLNTGSASTDGTDAIIIYDPTRLSTNNSAVASGTIYPDYPGNNVNESTGKITISGLASITSAFSGQGTLATITFTVKDNAPVGATQVKFDFDSNDKSKTTDSNVVERGTVADILSSVVNGNYVIGNGTNCVSSSGTGGQGGSSTSSGELQYKDLDEMVGGKTGNEQLTFTIAILGSVLTILGIMGLALL